MSRKASVMWVHCDSGAEGCRFSEITMGQRGSLDDRLKAAGWSKTEQGDICPACTALAKPKADGKESKADGDG